MNVEYIRYDVDPTLTQGFVEAMTKALALLEREPSVLDHELVQNSDDPRKFVVRIEWQTRDSQKAYLKHDDYAAFMSLVKPFNPAFVSMEFHDPVVARARRSPSA